MVPIPRIHVKPDVKNNATSPPPFISICSVDVRGECYIISYGVLTVLADIPGIFKLCK